MNQPATLTSKIENLYVAFAPRFSATAYGSCEDEALNNLTEELMQRQSTGDEGKTSNAAQ